MLNEIHKGSIVPLQATSGFWGRTSPQAAGLGCRITALQAETSTLLIDWFYVMNPE